MLGTTDTVINKKKEDLALEKQEIQHRRETKGVPRLMGTQVPR